MSILSPVGFLVFANSFRRRVWARKPTEEEIKARV